MTYNKFAKLNDCTFEEVAAICESDSGCTHYDTVNNRYLVLFNSSSRNHNVVGRIRWTLAHELGHVILNHLPYLAEPRIAENNFNNLTHPELESEADYFAATLLCPMPLFETLNVRTVLDIKEVFGLSTDASEVRMRDYIRWKRTHRKTAWENDLKQLYKRSLYASYYAEQEEYTECINYYEDKI